MQRILTLGLTCALATQDKNLSDKLARSNGVICPPPHIDPNMKQSAPSGGDQQIQPK